MAEYSQDNLVWILKIAHTHVDLLGQIRHWSNVKIASKDGLFWLKDFSNTQIESVELQSIPFKAVYVLKENKLFPFGSNLPEMQMPSSLLWSPIEAGIKVTLPSFNFNYFGTKEKIEVGLVASEAEQAAFAVLVLLKDLQAYIETAPAVRLKNLSWVIFWSDKALVLGSPLLPIAGDTFWRRENMLLPSGFDLNVQTLSKTISTVIDSAMESWLLWNNSGYVAIPKEKVKPLSLSSFRKSYQLLTTPVAQ